MGKWHERERARSSKNKVGGGKGRRTWCGTKTVGENNLDFLSATTATSRTPPPQTCTSSLPPPPLPYHLVLYPSAHLNPPIQTHPTQLNTHPTPHPSLLSYRSYRHTPASSARPPHVVAPSTPLLPRATTQAPLCQANLAAPHPALHLQHHTLAVRTTPLPLTLLPKSSPNSPCLRDSFSLPSFLTFLIL